MKTADLQSFTDEEVQHHFGISVSRLRTAQRYGLASSDISKVGSNQARTWHADMVLRVFLAERFSGYSGLAFNVSACAIAVTTEERWDVVTETVFGGQESISSRLYVINRHLVVVEIVGEKPFTAGIISVDRDGRSSFTTDIREVPDTNGGTALITSKLEFNPDPEVDEFRRLYRKATKQRRA